MPNLVQSFIARCAAQTREYTRENVTILGQAVMGEFGAPTLQPLMTRSGYRDVVTTVLSIEKALLTATPPRRVTITREQTGTSYFVQGVDSTDAVFYHLVLVNREDDL